MKAICKDYAEFKNITTVLKTMGPMAVLFTTQNSPMPFRAAASCLGCDIVVLLDAAPQTWAVDFPQAVEVQTILN